MSELRYTLVTEGTSDRSLIPLLNWMLIKQGITCPISSSWADLRRIPNPSKTLQFQISQALDLYPCDLLFAHRDADRDGLDVKREQMNAAINEIASVIEKPPIVCVIPNRMLEAWLLFDELAIRSAAGNPNGSIVIDLPRLRDTEAIIDPKNVLNDILRQASGLSGRRLKKFSTSEGVHHISEYIDDFSPLRALPSFAALEANVADLVASQGWAES